MNLWIRSVVNCGWWNSSREEHDDQTYSIMEISGIDQKW